MWNNLPKKFALNEGEVHVFYWQLSAVKQDYSLFNGFLSPDEMARAQRYKFEIHRRRFTINRMYLRTLLSYYLGEKPEDLCFHYNAHGKPFLENQSIYFNLSDSEDCGILAISREKLLGADVEYLKPKEDFLDLARRFFAAQEVEQLEGIPDHQKLSAFYRLWTLKEAFMKALGQGLSLHLNSFAIELKTPKLLFAESELVSSPWSFSQTPEIKGYATALAIAMAHPQWRFYQANDALLI